MNKKKPAKQKTIADVFGECHVKKIMAQQMAQICKSLCIPNLVVNKSSLASLPLDPTNFMADKSGSFTTMIETQPIIGPSILRFNDAIELELEDAPQVTEYPEPPLGFIDDQGAG